jgi:hypothetical protein
MKKIVLLVPILLLSFSVAFSQSFTLSVANGPITHDTIIDVYAPASTEIVEKHVFITNTSSGELKILVKKENLEILEGTDNSFCFNGLCFPPFVIVAPYALTLQPGHTSSDTDFYGDYYPFGHTGSSVIRYTFFVESNVNDSLSVRIRYNTFNPSLSLSDEGGAISHDTIIELIATPDTMSMKAHILMSNISTDTIWLLVKKEVIEQLADTYNTFCWIDLCYPPDVILSPVPMPVAPGATTTETDFYTEYIPNGQAGNTFIRYTLYNRDYPADSISVVFKFNTGNVGIADLPQLSSNWISKPYPNPASSSVSFDLDLPTVAGDAAIVIRNLLGAEVLSVAVNNRTGKMSLPVAQLSEGLYFYTLTVQGNYPVQTGRIVIKK